MIQHTFLVFCAFAVLASALVSGIFLAFSDFVMRSFASVTPAGSIESMQAINRDVYDSLFIKLLVGVAPLTVFLSVIGYFLAPPTTTAWLVAGAVVYLVGVIAVTVKRNVPMNQQLDAMDYASAEAASYWITYLAEWTRWNHIRAASAGVSSICFLVATWGLAHVTI